MWKHGQYSLPFIFFRAVSFEKLDKLEVCVAVYFGNSFRTEQIKKQLNTFIGKTRPIHDSNLFIIAMVLIIFNLRRTHFTFRNLFVLLF